jgi:hypothetical protein
LEHLFIVRVCVRHEFGRLVKSRVDGIQNISADHCIGGGVGGVVPPSMVNIVIWHPNMALEVAWDGEYPQGA